MEPRARIGAGGGPGLLLRQASRYLPGMTHPIAVQGFDHIVLRVRDKARALDFYCGVLGLSVDRDRPELGLTHLRAGPQMIDLVTLDGRLGQAGGVGPGSEGRNLDHFCLNVRGFDLAAVKAHLGPDRHAILLPLNEFEQQLSLALQQDDPLLRDGDNRGNFSSPGFRRVLAFYANIFEQGWAPGLSETQISNVWDEFFNGAYAFYLSGPWNVREFRKREPPELAGQWGTMALPGPDGPGAGIAGGSSLVIFRSSPNKDAAWKLVEYLSRPAVQQRFHAVIGNLPPGTYTIEAWHEKLGTHLFFEISNLLADRRLGDEVPLGGQGKTLQVHQVAENFQCFDVHKVLTLDEEKIGGDTNIYSQKNSFLLIKQILYHKIKRPELPIPLDGL